MFDKNLDFGPGKILRPWSWTWKTKYE